MPDQEKKREGRAHHRRDHRAVAHEKGQPEGCPQTPSTPSATRPRTYIVISSDRGQLARLASATPDGLARALPAFGAPGAHNPVRATTACHRCTARRGIGQPVPVHLPAHYKVCARHGIWLSDVGQPHLDLATCPEIIAAQYRASRLLRRCTPRQLMLAYQAAARAIPSWPASPAAIPHHWRHRLLILQTANYRYGTPTGHDAYIHAAIYPDAIAAAELTLATHARSSKIRAGPE